MSSEEIGIVGICGTFMAGVAVLAHEMGRTVFGCDQHVYPPMSDLLASKKIITHEGYDAAFIDCQDSPQWVVGNVVGRGNPVVEAMLNQGVPMISGPQWLYDNLLQNRWVIAVSGTHGKTTTSAMIAWILEYAGMKPGFLIGGIPNNFGTSARVGESSFFVVEADEYDSAFFDKRSKFVHYRPRTLVINNLEFDHADIFPDLAAIQKQFHHLVRMVPSEGLIIYPETDSNIVQVIKQGCWTPAETLSLGTPSDKDQGMWRATPLDNSGAKFEVYCGEMLQGEVNWGQLGKHNIMNGLAAIAAAQHSGVPARICCQALCEFTGVKRRMELIGDIDDIAVYDDFAHHPTAIATTLQGLRMSVGNQRIISVLEPRSNTMRLGVHTESLAPALELSDAVLVFAPPDINWDIREALKPLGDRALVFHNLDKLLAHLLEQARSGDHILVMSNGGFGGLHGKLLDGLETRGD